MTEPVSFGRGPGNQARNFPGQVSIALEGRMVSSVTPTPIAEQLYVGVPVREHGLVVGAALIRRTIEVEYPLDNAYVRSTRLSNRLPEVDGPVGALRVWKREGASRLLRPSYQDSSTVLTAVLWGVFLLIPRRQQKYHQERDRAIAIWRSLLILLTLGAVLLTAARYAGGIILPSSFGLSHSRSFSGSDDSRCLCWTSLRGLSPQASSTRPRLLPPSAGGLHVPWVRCPSPLSPSRSRPGCWLGWP